MKKKLTKSFTISTKTLKKNNGEFSMKSQFVGTFLQIFRILSSPPTRQLATCTSYQFTTGV
jgi:hypothetical protein